MTLRGSFRPTTDAPWSAVALRQDIGEGLRWLWRHRLLRTLALKLAALNLAVVAQVSIMVLFAEERLDVGPAGYGLLLTAHATGALLGSLAAARVIARLGSGRVLRVGLLIEAATPSALALTRSPLVAGAIFVALVWGALLVSLRQELTPDRLRGRVESAYRLLESGSAAPGALLGGLLAARFGLAAPFWFNALAAGLMIPLVWSTLSEAAVSSARRDAIVESS